MNRLNSVLTKIVRVEPDMDETASLRNSADVSVEKVFVLTPAQTRANCCRWARKPGGWNIYHVAFVDRADRGRRTDEPTQLAQPVTFQFRSFTSKTGEAVCT